MDADTIVPDDGQINTQHESANDSPVKQFHNFASEATLHGVNRFANQTSGWPRRLLWLLLWLLLFAVVFRFIIGGTIRYLSYPYTVHVTYENIHNHTFPDVTICNNNLISKSYFQHDPLARRFVEELDYRRSTELLKIPGLIEWMKSIEFTSVFIKGATPAGQIVSNCYYSAYPTRCPNMTQIITNRGVCYTLSGFVGHDGQSIVSVFPGTDYAFKFHVDVNSHEYSPHTSNGGVGVKIIIHPHDVPPNTDKLFAVAPGTEQYVALQVTQTRRLGLPYSDECRPEKGYSQEKCRQDCIARHVFDHCGCDVWGRISSVVNCSLAQFAQCWGPAHDSAYSHENDRNCTCPLPCEETTFNVELSNLKYPSNAAVEKIKAYTGHSKEYLEKNIIEINLYFQSFIAQMVHEEPSYGLGEFAADAGGQMGLFLGASIISISEFFELLLDICLHKMKRLKKKSASVASNK